MLKARRSFAFNFSFFKDPRFIGLALLCFILGALPFTLFQLKQQQTTTQRASTTTWNNGNDTCGKVHVFFYSEVPNCSSGTALISSYSTSVQLTSLDGASHQVNYLFESFWCQATSELGDGVNPASCIKRVKNNPGTTTVSSSSKPIIASVTQTSTERGFAACGVYQTDFSFTIAGTSCHFGYSALDTNPNHPVMAAGYCNTNATCVVPSNTPPPTATPTIPVNTPTNSPTPLPSDTPVPSSTPTDTPTDTPTGTPSATVTPTVTPTGTLTPSATPTITPTGNPTATPTPPSTPPPTVIVVKPTLPPTGPSSTLLSIGLVGVALSVLGMIFLLGL